MSVDVISRLSDPTFRLRAPYGVFHPANGPVRTGPIALPINRGDHIMLSLGSGRFASSVLSQYGNVTFGTISRKAFSNLKYRLSIPFIKSSKIF